MAGGIENQAGHQVPVGTSAIMVHSGQGPGGTAFILPFGGNTGLAVGDDASYHYPCPRPGTIRNGRVLRNANFTGGGTYTITIRVNHADSLVFTCIADGSITPPGVARIIPGTVSVPLNAHMTVRVDGTAPNVNGLFEGVVAYEIV